MIQDEVQKTLSFLEDYSDSVKNLRIESSHIHNQCDKLVENCAAYIQELEIKQKKLINLQNLTEDSKEPLIVGLVGGFSTGKSSFINCFLEDKILVEAVHRSTARIIKIIYGEKLKITCFYNDGRTEEIDLKTLTSLSTHKSEANNHHQEIAYFLIEHPAPVLKEFTLIDTPGFSSTSGNDDNLTLDWIPHMQLVLWFFTASKPVGKMDVDLLKNVEAKEVIGVINKVDLKPPKGRENVRNYLKDSFDGFQTIKFYSSMDYQEFLEEKQKNRREKELLFAKIEEYILSNQKFTFNYAKSEYYFSNSGFSGIISCSSDLSNEAIDFHAELLEELKKSNLKIQKKITNKKLQEKEKSTSKFIKTIYKNLSLEYNSLLNKSRTELKILLEEKEAFTNYYLKELNSVVEWEDGQCAGFKNNITFSIYMKLFEGKNEGLFKSKKIAKRNKVSSISDAFFLEIITKLKNKFQERYELMYSVLGWQETIETEDLDLYLKKIAKSSESILEQFPKSDWPSDIPFYKGKRIKKILIEVLPWEELFNYLKDFYHQNASSLFNSKILILDEEISSLNKVVKKQEIYLHSLNKHSRKNFIKFNNTIRKS